MKLLLLALMLVSCKPIRGKPHYIQHPLRMHCIEVGSNLSAGGRFYQCENSEVICYQNRFSKGVGLSCKWRKNWDWKKGK